jgi:NAD+ diphosphatase
MTFTFVAGIDGSAETDSAGLWFCVRRGEVLMVPGGPGTEQPLIVPEADPGLPHEGLHFLGRLDGRPCWAAGLELDAEPTGGGRFVELRSLYGSVAEPVWTLAGRAIQIVEWDRTHRFCGRCATPTEAVAGERSKRCPACGLLAFPRLAPAVIVIVERGDEMLLARNRTFPMPMYSAVAGFVEPGETLEEAVHREVAEEVGVELTDLRYFASQPWPFPHSLMIGFFAQWAGGDIRVDEMEIMDARWFRADDLPMIPPKMSIARSLIDDFLSRTRA